MKLNTLVGGVIMVASLFACEVIDDLQDSVEDIQNMDKAADAIVDFGLASKEFAQVKLTGASYVAQAETEIRFGQGTTKSTDAIITIVPYDQSFPKTVTIDFGDGVRGIDGVLRSGKMQIILENGWGTHEGDKQNISLVNYYQETSKVEGTYKSERKADVMGAPVFEVSLDNGKVTKSSGEVITYTQNTTHTKVEGDSTPLIYEDDAHEIVGTQSGISSKGYSYIFKADADAPLYHSANCRYIRSGELDIEVEGIELLLDYGEMHENCEDDSSATLIYKSIEKEITL
ncbi:hypothetical protein [Saccharicrinis aurantiacus]|uniref:hypothetical protein n=1 Tax=Saccharicrinis aurantiacus TaxID=1849719 RepID=UPI00248FF4F6|nr:hypothetical protein [Saccharicrinis aurantiacus]